MTTKPPALTYRLLDRVSGGLLSRLSTTLAQLQEREVALSADVQRLENLCADLSIQLANTENRLQVEIANSINRFQVEIDAMATALRPRIDAAAGRQNELQAALETLAKHATDRWKSLEAEIETLQHDLAAADADGTRFRVNLQEAAAERVRLQSELDARLKAIETDLDMLHHDLVNSDAETARFRSHLQFFENRILANGAISEKDHA